MSVLLRTILEKDDDDDERPSWLIDEEIEEKVPSQQTALKSRVDENEDIK